MIKVILIDDNLINEINIKNTDDSNIYKKCGYKSNSNFNKITNWNYKDNYTIELWSKIKGNFKNNFSLFIDNNINIYGKAIFILKDKNNIMNSLFHDDFINFFKLNNSIEDNNTKYKNDIKEKKDTKEITLIKEKTEIKQLKGVKEIKDIENNNDYSDNENIDSVSLDSNSSVLTYELYEYSSDNE